MIPGTLALLAFLAAGPAAVREPFTPQQPHQAHHSEDTSLAGLPRRIVRDFGRMGSGVPLRILGAGGALAAASHPADQAVLRSLSSSKTAEDSLDGGTPLGSAAVQFGLAGAVYGVGLATGHARAAQVGTALLEAQIVGGLITQGLKYAVDRDRPDGGHHSFPSGHTESAFATADVLTQQFGWKAGLAAYAAAAYVGAARIAEREHYLSDVAFGAAIGVAASRATTHRPIGSRLQIAPAVTRHRAALFLVFQRAS